MLQEMQMVEESLSNVIGLHSLSFLEEEAQGRGWILIVDSILMSKPLETVERGSRRGLQVKTIRKQ